MYLFSFSFYYVFFPLTFRFDGHLIDSRDQIDHSNPFAVGHKVNHTPQDVLPNVVQVPFDFLGLFAPT